VRSSLPRYAHTVKLAILRLAVPSGGAVVMLIGAALLLFRPGASVASFGWSAYAPLSDTRYVPAVSAYLPVASALVLIGFCAIAGWVGFELGRARSQLQ